MVVNVTPAQYAYIAEAMLQAEMTRDPKDVPQLPQRHRFDGWNGDGAYA